MQKNTINLSHQKLQKNNTVEYSDKGIIEGIIKNSNITLEYVYKKYYPKIKSMVLSLRNTVLIPEDIFQEGLTRVILNIKNGKFREESSFYTYLNRVCKNVALRELNRYRNVDLSFDVEMEEDDDNYEVLSALAKLLDKTDKICREIISLRFNLKGAEKTENKNPDKNLPFEEIAEIMNLSVANSRQRFKRCIDKLREMVYDNPELREYYD